MSRSTDTLRMARSRLATWRAKIEALLRVVDEFEEEERESLRDRFQRIETGVLKLGRLETAWSEVAVRLRNRFRELETAYELLASRIDAQDRLPAKRLTEASKPKDSH